MITVAAVGIIWAVIIPMVRDNLETANICNKVDISIVTSQGYTCYRPNNLTIIQVGKGNSNISIVGLRFYLTYAGNSLEYDKRVSFLPNDFKVFPLNSSLFSVVEKISVAPVVQVGNSIKTCSAVEVNNIKLCSEGPVYVSSDFSSEVVLLNETHLINPSPEGGNSPFTGSNTDVLKCIANDSCTFNTCFNFNCTDSCGNNHTGILTTISSVCPSQVEIACGVVVTNNSGQCGGTNCSVVGMKCDNPLEECVEGSCRRIQNGSADFPFLINTCEQLQNMSNNLTTNFKLAKDVDCINTSSWNWNTNLNLYNGFVPIGSCVDDGYGGCVVTSSFSGNFNGDSHTISNLYINRLYPFAGAQGLFGAVSSTANISNVSLINVNVSGSDYVGALIGRQSYGSNYAALYNCHSTGVIYSRSSYVGGLVGEFYGGIYNSDSSVNIYLSGSSNTFVGGLVGKTNGLVSDSFSSGSFFGSSGADQIGGLIGRSYSDIKRSYSVSNVVGYSNVGGLAGYSDNGLINNSYSTGIVTGYGYNIGGLVGLLANYHSGNINNSYSTGTVIGFGSNVGGLVGQQESATSTISNSYSTGNVNGSSNVGGLVGQASQWIISSYSTGKVNATGNNCGGLVGYLYKGKLNNTYSRGSVNGPTNVVGKVGGLVGNATGISTSLALIYNSYSTGNVTGSTSATIGCGLAGSRSFYSGSSSSYWDNETSGRKSSATGTLKTTLQMKTQSTFGSAWNFNNVWAIDASKNDGYPYLRWQTF